MKSIFTKRGGTTFIAMTASLALTLMAGTAIAQTGKISRNLIQRNVVDPFKLPAKTIYSQDHIVVDYYDAINESSAEIIEARYGLELKDCRQSKYFRILSLTKEAKQSGMTVESAVRAMLQHPEVRFAEFDVALEPDYIPNDSRFGDMWGLHNTGQSGGTADADIDMPEAWDTGSHPEVVVAVCDDGYDFSHPDLDDAYYSNPGEIPGNGIDDDSNGFIDDYRGWDFSDDDNNPQPSSGSHGTHTSGTVGAEHNNGIGVTGFGTNVKVMPMRMYTGSNPWMSALANSVDYAWENGASVISVSYNINSFTQALVDSIGRAETADVVYCNSAGNGNDLDPPRGVLRSMFDNVIFAAASDRNDTRASFSNYGSLIDIFAPGVDVLSTVPGNGYSEFSGTSMACPHLAGAIAVVRAHFPAMTARQSLDRVIGSGDEIPGLASFVPEGRRLNLVNALDSDSVPPAPVTGLEITRRAYTAAEFKMNASGDDGMSGAASSYDVRVSPSPITDGNFASATQVSANIPSLPAGTPVMFQAAGFAPGKPVYIGVKAIDNLGNASPVSTFGPFATKPGIWEDNVEGPDQWTPQGSWAKTTNNSLSPTHSWTDSPGGDYGNNADLSLTMTNQVSISGLIALRFMADYELETNFDYLRVEVSRNNGPWEELGRLTGTQGWSSHGYLVDAGAGQNLRFRFRLTSDGSQTRDGAYIDDISIVPMSEVFADDVEGLNQFTSIGGWARTTSSFNSPANSWTDSPGGNYGNNVLSSIVGNSDIDIRGIAAPALLFMANHNLETNYDYVNAQVSFDSGGNYTTLTRLNGDTGGSWVPYSAQIGGGDFIRLKFELDTDGSVVRDGAYIDDIRVVGEPWEVVQIVRGKVVMIEYLGNYANRPVTVEVRNPGSTSALETHVVSLVPTGGLQEGEYMIVTGQLGNRDIAFNANSFLRNVVSGVNITNGMGLVNTKLIIGDADNDNDVDQDDYDYVESLLNTGPGDPGWDPLADVNGTGFIDILDLKRVYEFLGETGAN